MIILIKHIPNTYLLHEILLSSTSILGEFDSDVLESATDGIYYKPFGYRYARILNFPNLGTVLEGIETLEERLEKIADNLWKRNKQLLIKNNTEHFKFNGVKYTGFYDNYNKETIFSYSYNDFINLDSRVYNNLNIETTHFEIYNNNEMLFTTNFTDALQFLDTVIEDFVNNQKKKMILKFNNFIEFKSFIRSNL